MEGGALSGALPHFSLGREPISKMSLPPLTKSSCVNHGLSSACPFNVADWMYLFLSDTFLASMTKVFPPPTLSVTLPKMGLPIS